MKNRNRTALITALVLGIMGTALVAIEAHADDSGPCKEIKASCEAAGFKKGGHNAKTNVFKGLYKDCIMKIMHGETVEGVNVPAEKVAACKAKKDKRAEKKAAKAAKAAAPAAK